jgi:DNA-binding response OmpR family regulator
MQNILVVDDDITRLDRMKATILNNPDYDVYYAATTLMAQDFIKWQKWDVIFLDHDLGEEDGSGYIVAQAVLKNPPYQVIVHSMNPTGAENIMKLLKGHVQELHRIPFHKLVQL